jgi:glycosyltransferase involved in cell wall biosynthesis
MTANPLVSIIIPAFNSAPHIEETLQSVRAQTYPHFEVIIMDGGSTDATVAIAQAWAGGDPRFKWFRQSDRATCTPRVSAARNEAVDASTGELLAFLDADDIWFPEKLARQVELFRQHPAVGLTFTNYYYWDGVRDLDLRYGPGNFPPNQPRTRLIYSCLYGMSSVMARREIFQQANGFDESIPAAEDWDLWLRLAENGLETRGITEPMLRYRLHPGNASKQTIRTGENAIRLLEKNRDRWRFPADRGDFERALQNERCKLELARARQWLDTDPARVAPAMWRAWRLNPGQFKWLWRWACAAWPPALGGGLTRAYAHRKLRAKF